MTPGWQLDGTTIAEQPKVAGSPNSFFITYYKTCDISCTKSQNLNDSHLVLQSLLPNPLKPGVKSRKTMWLEQRRQAMLQLHLSDQQFYCLLRCDLYHRFDSSSQVEIPEANGAAISPNSCQIKLEATVAA